MLEWTDAQDRAIGGVYFVTQSPMDVPDTVLAQLGNRIQFSLRAFTPKDRNAVKKIAGAYRLDPAKKPRAALTEVTDAITTMGVGEALVSPLQPDGTPMPVVRWLMAPPRSSMGKLPLWERVYPAEFDLFQQRKDPEPAEPARR